MDGPSAKPTFGVADASFQAAGGESGICALVESFYQEMDQLPEARIVREMHGPDLTEVKDKLARFLCGWLGGPRRYNEKYGPIHIPNAHQIFPIGSAERDAWLLCMQRAVEAQPFSPEFKAYFMKVIRVPAERVRNRD
jgi:hemoglobin